MKPVSAPIFRVYFRNTCYLKDTKVRQSLVNALFTHFSDNEASIYIVDCSWSQESRGKEHQIYDLVLIRVSNEGHAKYERYRYKILGSVPSFVHSSDLYLKEWGYQEKLAYEKPYEQLKPINPPAEENLIEGDSRGMHNH